MLLVKGFIQFKEYWKDQLFNNKFITIQVRIGIILKNLLVYLVDFNGLMGNLRSKT